MKKLKKENYDFGEWRGPLCRFIGILASTYGDNLKVCFFDDLVKDRVQFTSDICSWLGIDFEGIDSTKMVIENKSMLYRSKSLQRFCSII